MGVDDDHARPVAPCDLGQTCCRVDCARRADHQHQLTLLCRLLCPGPGLARQRLAKPHDGRPQQIAAGGAMRRLARDSLLHVARRTTAIQPAIPAQLPMQAQHTFTARLLVQTIHVLRDECHSTRMLSRPTRQRQVPLIGSHLGNQRTSVLVPAPDMSRIAAIPQLAGHFLGLELGPIPVCILSESGHSRLGADTCPGQHGQSLRLPQPATHAGNRTQGRRRIVNKCLNQGYNLKNRVATWNT